MSLPKWDPRPEADGPRYRAHSNRFKRMRALARDITLQGTSKAAALRGLVAQWWKLARNANGRGFLDFSMREKFKPPTQEQGVLARIKAHWASDHTQGWPDPSKYRIWVVARNAPDTFRWAYRRIKALGA